MGYSDGKEAPFHYNNWDELVELTDWNGTASVECDQLGRAVKVIDPAGQLLSLTQPGSTAAYGYNACGLPVSAKYQMEDGNFMQETLSYDNMGRITASLREGSSPAFARSAEYAYDSVGRLLSVKEGDATESYGYDALGNRILKQLNGASKATYQYNALNQLVNRTEDGVQYSYGYDRRGNLIQERRGEDFNAREAFGAAANGAIIGGVRGALIGSEVGTCMVSMKKK